MVSWFFAKVFLWLVLCSVLCPLDWRNQHKDEHLIFNQGVLPALTLNVNNTLRRKLKLPNLMTLSKIHLEIIWNSKSLSIKLDVTIATAF